MLVFIQKFFYRQVVVDLSNRDFNSIENEIKRSNRNFIVNSQFRKSISERNEHKDSLGTSRIVIFSAVIIVLMVAVNVLKYIDKNIASDTVAHQDESKTEITEPKKSMLSSKPKAIPMPQTSYWLADFGDDALCPLKIVTNSSNYYIKLQDIRSDEVVAKFFINPNDSVEIKIPPGSYYIKYGSGNNWYGEEELFGNYANYSKSETLNFRKAGYTYMGHTVVLHKVVDGNLHSTPVSKEFLAKD